jgi:hypothetical protein
MAIIGIGVVLDICYNVDFLPKELIIMIIEYNYTIPNKKSYASYAKILFDDDKIIEKFVNMDNYDTILSNQITTIVTQNMQLSTTIYNFDDYILNLCDKYESFSFNEYKKIKNHYKKKESHYSAKQKMIIWIYDLNLKHKSNSKKRMTKLYMYDSNIKYTDTHAQYRSFSTNKIDEPFDYCNCTKNHPSMWCTIRCVCGPCERLY